MKIYLLNLLVATLLYISVFPNSLHFFTLPLTHMLPNFFQAFSNKVLVQEISEKNLAQASQASSRVQRFFLLTSPRPRNCLLFMLFLFSPWAGSGKGSLAPSRRSRGRAQVAPMEAQAHTTPNLRRARCMKMKKWCQWKKKSKSKNN